MVRSELGKYEIEGMINVGVPTTVPERGLTGQNATLFRK